MGKNVYKIKNLKKLSTEWPYILGYFLLARFVLGSSYTLSYILFIAVFLFRIPLSFGALVFFIVAIIVYILGGVIEANHYMSFVYGFLVLFLLKSLYITLKQNFGKTN